MDLAYLVSATPDLLQGLAVTIEATLFGFAIASVVGLLIALPRLLHIPILSQVLGLYILFVRNTPLLVQLYFLYYVLPVYGIVLDALVVGLVGLGVQFSGYTAEVYRAGLENVPRGQWEAARAVNLSTVQTLALVVIPQAFRPIVPPLGNYLISMFKDSSVLATVTVLELYGTANSLAATSFQYTTATVGPAGTVT